MIPSADAIPPSLKSPMSHLWRSSGCLPQNGRTGLRAGDKTQARTGARVGQAKQMGKRQEPQQDSIAMKEGAHKISNRVFSSLPLIAYLAT